MTIRSSYKTIIFIAILFAVLGGVFSLYATDALAQTAQSCPPGKYCPISPFIPNSASGLDPKNAQDYFTNVFKYSIIIGGILAMIVITYAGIEYLMSGSFSNKEEAKKRIWAAIGGLALILVSYIILNTINPQLTRFDFRSISTDAQATPPVINPGDVGVPPDPGKNQYCYTFLQSNDTSTTCFDTRDQCNSNRNTVTAADPLALAAPCVFKKGSNPWQGNPNLPDCKSGFPATGQCSLTDPTTADQCSINPNCTASLVQSTCTCTPTAPGVPSGFKVGGINMVYSIVLGSSQNDCPAAPTVSGSNYRFSTISPNPIACGVYDTNTKICCQYVK